MSRRNSRYQDRYEDRWPAYVPVAERRRKAELEMAKLRKKGVTVSPVKIEGRVIASTFWGKAWCDNLESYRDYENRLERGRSYVRNGLVVDLQIAAREVTATVSGSALYKVKVSIGDVAKAQWKSICSDCAGGIDSLVELLQGRFSKGVMERICRQGAGLFPKPAEIRFSCSCPDYASMCKHVAAVLYGVGARLDAKPELLFRLRAVDENDLVADIGKVLPMSKQGPAAGKVLETDDMAALFGLDMAEAEAPVAIVGVARGRRKGGPDVAAAASEAGGASGARPKGASRGKAAPASSKADASGSPTAARKVAPAKRAVASGRAGIVAVASAASRNGKADAPSRDKSVTATRKPGASAAKPVAGKAVLPVANAQPVIGRAAVQPVALVKPGRSKPGLPQRAARAPNLARGPAQGHARGGATSAP
jgi:uncharacterized Zn finger protein